MTASVTPIARATIGGSTAAAACGIDPHHSRVALWLEMTGRVTTLESEPMKWGKLLEPVIFDELTTRGSRLSRLISRYTIPSVHGWSVILTGLRIRMRPP